MVYGRKVSGILFIGVISMCGRYVVYTDDEFEDIKSIVDEVSEKYKETKIANGEVFPTNNIPVIYNHNSRYVLSAAKWGFPNFKNSGVIINARAETIAEKPMFKKPFISSRCLVPANGYFEWLTHENKKKTKYLINLKEKSSFYMAGLYNMFTDKETDVPYAAIVIVTTDANLDISFIHNRMPVILPDNKVDTWLDCSIVDFSILQGLLAPVPAGIMSFKTA